MGGVFVGLVHARDSEPPEPDPDPAPRGWPRPPWRALAWLAAWLGLMLLAAVVGGFAGYLIVLVAVGLGSLRLERWCARQYWGGCSEYGRVG